MQERYGAVSDRGIQMTVLGTPLQVGDSAPDFRLIKSKDFSMAGLSDWDGQVRILSVIPSIDTRVCQMQTRKFNEAAASLGDDVVVLTISVDLPPAQRRWCGAEGIDRVVCLSDHRTMEFGDRYATHIKEWRQEQRAVFVVDRAGTLVHVEYVPTISGEPDYAVALAAAQAAAGAPISA